LTGFLAAFGCGDHDGVGIDFRDSEVSAEVEEVEGAEGTGDLDEIHVAGAADEYGYVVDLGAVEVEPEVGDGFWGLRAHCGCGVGVDEVLPAGGVIGGGESAHGFRGIEGGALEVIGVDGNAVEFSGRAFYLLVTVIDEGTSIVEHGAVEGDREVSGGLAGEVVEDLGDTAGLLGIAD
jgi:hypothetical protein